MKIVKIDKGYVCPGLFDFSADFQELEMNKRKPKSGIEAAINGGFTGIDYNPH